MATNTLIQIKRTTISGRPANTTTLTNAAELALNLPDGIMYSTNGTVVFEIGANLTSQAVTNLIFVGNSTVNAVVNSTSIKVSNSTSNSLFAIPLATDWSAGTKYLNANGSWATPAGAGGSPGGSNTHVQFNDSGAFGGDAGLVFDKVNDILFSGNSVWVGNSTVNNVMLPVSLKISNSTSNIALTVPAAADVTGGVKYLNANSSWVSPVAGANTQIQYNNSGAFAGDALHTWDQSTSIATYGNSTINATVAAITAVIKLANSTSNIAISIPAAADRTGGVKYLNANGIWATPAGGSSGPSIGLINMLIAGAITP